MNAHEPQRRAAVMRVRHEHKADYLRLHQALPDEVLASLTEAHIDSYSIFLRDGLLFSYLEYSGEDYEADVSALARHEATRQWWEIADACHRPLDTIQPGQWWAPAIEVFHHRPGLPSQPLTRRRDSR